MKTHILGEWEGHIPVYKGDTVTLCYRDKATNEEHRLCTGEITDEFILTKGYVFEFEDGFNLKRGIGGALGEE